MNGFDRWEPELYHHGILGMKWGIRRYQNPDGTWKPAGLKRRRVREMSDDELRRGIERKKLENEYKELNRSSLAKAAVSLGNRYLDYRENQRREAIDREKRALQAKQYETQKIQAKYAYKKSIKEATKAESDFRKEKVISKEKKMEYVRWKAQNSIVGSLKTKLAKAVGRNANEKRSFELANLNMDKKIRDLKNELNGKSQVDIDYNSQKANSGKYRQNGVEYDNVFKWLFNVKK